VRKDWPGLRIRVEPGLQPLLIAVLGCTSSHRGPGASAARPSPSTGLPLANYLRSSDTPGTPWTTVCASGGRSRPASAAPTASPGPIRAATAAARHAAAAWPTTPFSPRRTPTDTACERKPARSSATSHPRIAPRQRGRTELDRHEQLMGQPARLSLPLDGYERLSFDSERTYPGASGPGRCLGATDMRRKEILPHGHNVSVIDGFFLGRGPLQFNA
jgi:hypothetical protein